MKIVTIIVQILLGALFAFFGSNAFLQFMKMPPMEGHAGEFIGAMAATGYIKGVASFEVVGGLLLLSNRYAPLGLALLLPVIVNIDFYHLCMDQKGMPVAIVVSLLSLFLLWRYRGNFAGLLQPVMPGSERL